MTIIGGPFAVKASQVATNAEARAPVIRSIAGMSRYIHEMATGKSAAGGAGVEACVPRNPQNTYGVDYSGPPFGSAIRHIIAGCGGQPPTATLVGEKYAALVSSSTGSIVLSATFWNRPHARYDGSPYSRGYLVLRAQKEGVGTPDLDVVCFATGGNVDAARIGTHTVTSGLPQDYEDANLYFQLVPGYNTVKMRLTNTSSSAIRVMGWTINQIVKRSHT